MICRPTKSYRAVDSIILVKETATTQPHPISIIQTPICIKKPFIENTCSFHPALV